MHDWAYHLLVMTTGVGAGVINALAGGGPLLTLGLLTMTGVDPRVANLTSTVALSPGQIVAGFVLRDQLRHNRLGTGWWLGIVAVAGGAIGAGLLLVTTATAFRAIVPWLVLVATVLYAASAFPTVVAQVGRVTSRRLSSALFSTMAVYGGYFGGGNSFLVLALLGLTGHDAKLAGEIKNILIAAINLGAVITFVAAGHVNWAIAVPLAIGGIIGSLVGTHLYQYLSVSLVRLIVIIGGLGLAIWMFTH